MPWEKASCIAEISAPKEMQIVTLKAYSVKENGDKEDKTAIKRGKKGQRIWLPFLFKDSIVSAYAKFYCRNFLSRRCISSGVIYAVVVDNNCMKN